MKLLSLKYFSGRTLLFEDGFNLPKPLAGHCQVRIAKDKLLVYGGVTSISILNYTTPSYECSNQAYIMSNETWSLVPMTNPCTNNGQNLAYQQPCTSRMHGNDTEIVIVTFNQTNSCTSILNIKTYQWILLHTDVDIPLGGHLVTSLDKTRVFYLGGIFNGPRAHYDQSLDVYELGSSGWKLTIAKLPFGIVSNETRSYPSLHNITITY